MNLHTVILPFIRQEGRRTTIAITRLGFVRETSSQKAAQELDQAVTKWVNETKDGLSTWVDSTRDLNIGDLALAEQQFNKFLKSKHSIFLKEFEVVYLGDASEGSVNFDHILVDTNKLTRTEEEYETEANRDKGE